MINNVRNTVMFILNKDNNGYLTPDEFNAFARQAQLEIFEELFYDYNKWLAKRNLGASYSGSSDIPKLLSEIIDKFSTILFIGNIFKIITTTIKIRLK